MAADLVGYIDARHAAMGVVGYNGSAYVDFPGMLYGSSPKKTTVTNADIIGSFLAHQIRNATLESTVVKQLQAIEAVSTPRMFDYSNSAGTGFIQATPANWSSVKPLLRNWAAGDLAAMEQFITASGTSGRQIIVPQDGSRTVNSWVGNGYYLLQQTISSPSINVVLSSKITGNYKGGSASVVGRYVSNAWNVVAPTFQYAYTTAKSLDPIDMNSGYYLYDHDDLTTGSADFPFGLTLKRSYSSGIRTTKTALGYGWRHNFMMSVFKDSDPYEAFGDHNPLAAVTTVTTSYVMKDLLTSSTSPALSNTVTASLSASWLMDQLVNNAVTVQTNEGTRKFASIPTATGGVTYVAPPGDASVLSSNGTGNAFLMSDKFGTATYFNSDGNITSWKDSNSNTVTFTYSGTGASSQLTSVSNGMGRTLSLTYNGSSQLTAVSDGTRSVNYSYDATSNLTTYKNALGNSTTYAYDQPGRMIRLVYAAFPSTAVASNTYDSLDHVQTQTDAFGNVWYYLFANGYRSQEVDPLGDAHTYYHDGKGNLVKDIDQTLATTRYTYNGVGQRISETGPLGDSVSYTYDAKSNLLSKTISPIPGVTDQLTGNAATAITESWTYTGLSKPATHTDPLGNVASYSYDTRGNLTRIVEPSVSYGSGTTTPVTSVTYNSRGLPLTVTDPESKVTANTYDTSTVDLLKVTEDSGTGRLNLQTAYTYDAVGNWLTTKDPTGNTTRQSFDAERQLTSVTPPAPLAASVTQYSYNASGQRTAVSQATGNSSAPWLTTSTAYNAAGKQTTVTMPDGATSTTSYDAAGRPVTVKSSSRRQVRTVYDAAGRVLQVIDEVGGTLDTSVTQNLGSVTRETRTYYTGGLLATLADAKGNTLTHYYDGFERLEEIAYPGSSYDLFAYDAAGNRRVFQRRDGSQIWSTYDALGRAITKAPTDQPTISYSYDRAGHLLSAASSAGSSTGVSYGYDTAGRVTSEATGLFGTTALSLDANGNRTGLTLPSSAGSLAIANGYDALNRISAVYQGSTSGTRIAALTYDVPGRRSTLAYGPASGTVASTAISYTAASQPAQIAHTWNGASLSLGYAYNADHQRKSLSASDASFLPSGLAAQSNTYTTNSLNQYAAINGAAFAYDTRGNLTSDGVWSYTYDTENHLLSASKSGMSVAFSYDALGRRMWKTVTQNNVTTSTAWLSVGDQEMAEFQGVGTAYLTNRFVYGAGIDETLAQVDASGNLSYLFADALGSTVALANASGALTEKHAYTAYGLETVAGPGNAAFRFAGRRIDPETGLYHNRARAYSPTLGRFLQTDPIGTKDNVNLYAYVGNDPLSLTDPSGNAGYLSNSWAALSSAPRDISNFVSDFKSDPVGTTLTALNSLPPNPSMAATGFLGAASAEGRALMAGETGGGFTSLYRAVSAAELEQIQQTGAFAQGPNSLGGKWFAETAEHANQWGNLMNGAGNSTILRVEIPTFQAGQLMRVERLDGIGPARYGELDQLMGAKIKW